jgi:Tfp pilus assembly protein PilO
MQRQTNSIYTVTLAVIIAFVSFFISWKILVPKYQANKLKLAQTENEIIAASSKRDSLTTAKSDIDSLGLVYDKLFVAIPKDNSEPDLISEIEGMAGSYKLSVPSIQISSASGSAINSTNKNNQDQISITFTANGDFDGLNKLIKSIENNLKLMNIKAMTLSSGDKNMSLAVQITAYKLSGIPALTVTSSTIPETLDASVNSSGETQ